MLEQRRDSTTPTGLAMRGRELHDWRRSVAPELNLR